MSDFLGLASTQHQLRRFLGSLVAFHAFEFLSKLTVPKHLTGKQISQWTDCMVGLSHHFLICYFASNIISQPEESIDKDRLYGYSDRVNFLFGISTAYFCWDLSTCFRHGASDIGFVAHAVVCAFCYLFGQFPYLHWYGVRFLLFELSSIFMQIRQLLVLSNYEGFLFKMMQTMFGLSFFLVRILYGMPLSFRFWKDSIELLKSGKAHSKLVVCFYFVANVVINILNTFWMGLIIKKFFKNK